LSKREFLTRKGEGTLNMHLVESQNNFGIELGKT
jgi:hypothetical protein